MQFRKVWKIKSKSSTENYNTVENTVKDRVQK